MSADESPQSSTSEFDAVEPLGDESISWAKNVLGFSDKSLGEAIAMLTRHHNGVLYCDSTAAGLHLSGTFPLKDTDTILNAITQTFPVKIQSITRYRTNISPL